MDAAEGALVIRLARLGSAFSHHLFILCVALRSFEHNDLSCRVIVQEADGGAGGGGCGRRREHSSSAEQRDALEQRGEPAAPRAAHRRSGPHRIRSGRALLRFLRFVECCSCFVPIFCMCSLYSYVLRVYTVLYCTYIMFTSLL